MSQPLRAWFRDIRSEVDEIFRELVYRPWALGGPAYWSPPVDVHETNVAYLVEMEIPGVALADVSITINHCRLTISGERREVTPPQILHSRRECMTGPFRRSIEFAEPIEPSAIQATCSEGICKILVPKKKASVGRLGEREATPTLQVQTVQITPTSGA